MKRIVSLLLMFALLGAATGCGAQEKTVSKTSLKLDTVVTITLYDWTDPSTIDLAMAEIDRLDGLLSVEKEGSDLYRLAQAAGKHWVDISLETAEVLTASKEYYTLSQGYFDITVGPLIDLWNIQDDHQGHYPTQEELTKTLPLVRSDDLQVKDGKAYLAREGMKANLGAIAKGYIADKVKEFLMNQGVKHAVLDLGRNILLIGGKTDASNFEIGVQDPNGEDGKVYAYLSVKDKSIVTSGVYERYFLYDGVKYHHILDPFTGFPVENGLSSVTILSDNSMQGDALSTTCLLLGEEKGMALIESLDHVEALFITSDGESMQSSGFAAYVNQ